MLLPRPEESELAIAPPVAEPGYWAGAPSAVAGDDAIYLAYRMRRPVGRGRGYGVSVARSLVGPYITSLEMAGSSVTLLKVDDELLSLWDAPVRTPALRWGI